MARIGLIGRSAGPDLDRYRSAAGSTNQSGMDRSRAD